MRLAGGTLRPTVYGEPQFAEGLTATEADLERDRLIKGFQEMPSTSRCVAHQGPVAGAAALLATAGHSLPGRSTKIALPRDFSLPEYSYAGSSNELPYRAYLL